MSDELPHPLYLAGAALIALPIVLHLLRRDVAPPVPFTAVRLLRRARSIGRGPPPARLVLLAARVAALLLLAGVRAPLPRRRAGDRGGRRSWPSIGRSAWARRRAFERARALALARPIDQAGGDVSRVIAFDDRPMSSRPRHCCRCARSAGGTDAWLGGDPVRGPPRTRGGAGGRRDRSASRRDFGYAAIGLHRFSRVTPEGYRPSDSRRQRSRGEPGDRGPRHAGRSRARHRAQLQ